MKNNFTDFVRESVISKWLNLQINTPKKYLLNCRKTYPVPRKSHGYRKGHTKY